MEASVTFLAVLFVVVWILALCARCHRQCDRIARARNQASTTASPIVPQSLASPRKLRPGSWLTRYTENRTTNSVWIGPGNNLQYSSRSLSPPNYHPTYQNDRSYPIVTTPVLHTTTYPPQQQYLEDPPPSYHSIN